MDNYVIGPKTGLTAPQNDATGGILTAQVVVETHHRKRNVQDLMGD
jgi:hypothetical protein